ncbi:MAG: phosphoribosyltransferase [Patescibacteria group bacterium]|nr:phosphoribosyltransferase [Patescibacteria group bacterium]
MRFKDRADAGRRLAEKLLEYKQDNPIVFALPRGGVPVGYEVAQRLDASFDTFVVRKIGMPGNPEFGVGAIAPGDMLVLDTETLRSLGLKQEDLKDIIKKEKQELERRITRYKSGEWSRGASTNVIIVVDDGLATGVTALVALESAKMSYKPKKLIFASPVCARDSLESLRPLADKIVCVFEPENLMTIGEWYEDFPQTSDEEVLYYLNKAYEQKKKKSMIKSSE